MTQLNTQPLHAREFHLAEDDELIVAFDILNSRLVELDSTESRVLSHIGKQPVAIAQLIKDFENTSEGNIKRAVDELIKTDMIAYSPYPPVSRAEKEKDFNGKLEDWKTKDVMHICLNVTHQCNLNCDYCYGGDGTYGGPSLHMSRETAEEAVDFLIKSSGKSENCRITLFGGEPLLNFPRVKHVVEYAKDAAKKAGKNISFGMTTNAVLLDDEKTDFLIDEGIEVTFSFDGPKNVQDGNRKFKSNSGASTYDLIFPKILKYMERAKKENKPFFFRATVTRTGLTNMAALAKFFDELDTENIHYDIAEYPPGNTDAKHCVVGDDMNVFRKTVKQVAKSIRENGLEDEHSSLFSGALSVIENKTKKTSFCISPGVQYLGVSAEGYLYPCHRFVGSKETQLGDVRTGFDREKWLQQYADVNIYKSKVCSQCWLRYYCGGMCPANNYFLGNEMTLSDDVTPEPTHCLYNKMIFEEALVLYTHLANEKEANEALQEGGEKNADSRDN